MLESLETILNTPWKFINELKMLLLKPFVKITLTIKGVRCGKRFKFYGMPIILRYRGSKITMGANFENRNYVRSNPLGVCRPTIFCTWSKGAEIIIGNNVGITGGSIVANKKIEIGRGTLIGANCTITDTDFHPIVSKERRYDKQGIKSIPIRIGKNVFIGMNCIILKGVNIPDNTVVPAGEVVRKGKYGK